MIMARFASHDVRPTVVIHVVAWYFFLVATVLLSSLPLYFDVYVWRMYNSNTAPRGLQHGHSAAPVRFVIYWCRAETIWEGAVEPAASVYHTVAALIRPIERSKAAACAHGGSYCNFEKGCNSHPPGRKGKRTFKKQGMALHSTDNSKQPDGNMPHSNKEVL